MNITLTERNGVTILSLRADRLDAHNSDMVKDELKLLYAGDAKKVLVDLGEVRFIDSSGLGALVSGFKNAVSSRGRLALSGLQAQVVTMFELTRLNRVFDIFPTVEEAISSLVDQ
jgi:anti-sigma B factor antagonist